MQLAFSYDAMGRRISKTVQGAATQFLYDGMNTVQETQGSTINPILVGLGIDERFAQLPLLQKPLDRLALERMFPAIASPEAKPRRRGRARG